MKLNLKYIVNILSIFSIGCSTLLELLAWGVQSWCEFTGLNYPRYFDGSFNFFPGADIANP